MYSIPSFRFIWNSSFSSFFFFSLFSFSFFFFCSCYSYPCSPSFNSSSLKLRSYLIFWSSTSNSKYSIPSFLFIARSFYISFFYALFFFFYFTFFFSIFSGWTEELSLSHLHSKVYFISHRNLMTNNIAINNTISINPTSNSSWISSSSLKY